MQDPPLLLETIRLEHGRLPYLDDHQKRLAHSRALYYGALPEIDLAAAIKIPEKFREGIYKVRVIYGAKVEKIEFSPYAIRPVAALQMVSIDELDYTHKFADRRSLQVLFQERTHGDDVLLIRNGLLTDTSYANVALFDGKRWYTPAIPLLPGTARARLLEAGWLHPRKIYYTDLRHFRALRLINAMMRWDEAPSIEIGRINF